MHGLGQPSAQTGQTRGAEEKSKLDQMIAAFMGKIKVFYENFKGLQAQRDFVAKHPELQADYNDLMSRGSFIDAQIKRAKSLMQSAQGAWNWFLSTIGLGDVGDLEALPLIPVAIAAGAAAIALITKWLTDAYIFSRKVNAIQELEAKGGITSREAARRISAAGPTGLFDVLQKNVIWLVIGGTLLMFGPEILKWIQRTRG